MRRMSTSREAQEQARIGSNSPHHGCPGKQVNFYPGAIIIHQPQSAIGMSVDVTFEQDGGNGLVAVGSSLWEAARRLGVGVRADCKGLGECDACAVQIVTGSESLSAATAAELRMLGAERLLAGERLACQTILVGSGTVVARVVPPAVEEKERPGKTLPFRQQLGGFIETEAKAISEALNMITSKKNALVAKFLNLDRDKPDTGKGRPETAEKPKQN